MCAFAIACFAAPLAAEEPSAIDRSLYPLGLFTCPDKLLRRCCDDYCPKCQPCVPFLRGSCCDDYCSKSSPCVPCFHDFTCGSYCPKPCPDLCRPLAADYFTCDVPSCDCIRIGGDSASK